MGPIAVKTFGPFAAGLGHRFVVPEEDAFEAGWFESGELEVRRNGGGGDGEEVVVEMEPEEGEESLVGGGGGDVFYPMVIVLEAVGEEGVVEVEKGSAGGVRESVEGPKSNNLQMTYCSLLSSTNNDHASYTVKVLKQKVLIDGIPCLLQDIFGYTDPTGTVTASNPNLTVDLHDLQTMRECVVCMSELKDTIVLPCRHLCLCHGCGDALRMQGRSGVGARSTGPAPKCPICRQAVESLLQIRLPPGVPRGRVGSLVSRQTSVGGGEGSSVALLEK
ncbi:hypothetical protein HDU98_010854 [Podochytrium sp. JEL0797]|nr:hypothetical protein HDU98_010854 [Podochytrium sp. JEL0797]